MLAGEAKSLGKRLQKPNPIKVFVAILIVMVIPLVCLLSVPRAGSGPVAGTSQCRNNFKQIAEALEEYHDHFGSYPPAYVADANGKPLYSWRVLILPFVDFRPTYDAFDLSKAWDDPHNNGLTAPDVFQCPVSPMERSLNTTNYLAIIGPSCAWRRSKPMRRTDFVGNDPSKTILLVEVADSNIHWAQPRDFELSKMTIGINNSDTKGVSSHHCRDLSYMFKNGKPGANVLFADGHAEYLPATFDTTG